MAFDEPDPDGMVAAGYQVSTAEDMARFVAALANGGLHEGVDIAATWGSDRGIRLRHRLATPGGQAGAIVSQSGSTLTSNANLLVMPSRHLGVVVLLIDANPIQLSGIPGGAAEVAADVMAMRARTTGR